MKCQQCNKTGDLSYHRTDQGQAARTASLRRARAAVSDRSRKTSRRVAPSLAGVLAQQLAVGQTAEELARLDQRSCPVCGITFFEFRNQGRLGCPYDYVCFRPSWSR